MRKHKKFLVIAVAAALVLTVGLTTVALADSTSDGDNGPVRTFISKVASILGLGEEQVADAFEQARQEIRDEAQGQCLQDAVEEGRITEEEADQIRQWWQNRPEALEEFGCREGLQLRHAWRHQWLQRSGPCQSPLDQPRLACIFDQRLTGTITDVTEGTITISTEDDTEGTLVTFEYDSNTSFLLRGVTAIEEGQTATALCWEDTEGNLTARFVLVGLP